MNHDTGASVTQPVQTASAGSTRVVDPTTAANGAQQRGHPRVAGLISPAAVFVVLAALTATLLGGGLAVRNPTILDGNTWLLTSPKEGLERLLRINPGTAEPDLEVTSPLPPGAEGQLLQSNVTTAIVDASTGATHVWDPSKGDWVASQTKISGATALHLTATEAFTVDRDHGEVTQRDPKTLAQVGQPLRLGEKVSASSVDGGGRLWIALPRNGRVAQVSSAPTGPSVVRAFELPTAGRELGLTSLRSGVLALDPGGQAFRVIPEQVAAEQLDDVPIGPTALPAVSSDDDTGALLDTARGTVHRIAPTGDERSGALSLPAQARGHQLGNPLIFGGRVYVPDYSAGVVWRQDDAAMVQATPAGELVQGGGRFDLFVDDGRLWINGKNGTTAFTVDHDGTVTRVDKYKRQEIPRPSPSPSSSEPTRTTEPDPTPTKDRRDDRRTEPTRAPEPRTRAPRPPRTTERSSPARPTTTTQPPTTTTTTTSEPPPGAPRNLSAEVAGDGALLATWQPPRGDAATVTGWRVTWSAGGEGRGQRLLPAGTTELTIDDLTPGTRYTITVSARSSAGTGEAASVRAIVQGRPEVAVQDVRATGQGKLVVDFGVDSRGGSDVTCTVSGGGQDWEGGCDGDTSVELTGLGADRAVDVTVTARNPAIDGEGTATGAGRTWPEPSVEISKGDSARGEVSSVDGEVCRDPSCAWVVIRAKYFNEGTYDTHAFSGTGDFGVTNRITIDGDGNGYAHGSGSGGLNRSFYYGYSGGWVEVTVDGVRSNRIGW